MVKRFVAQNNAECQPLRIYGPSRYIINTTEEWQFLFNQDSSLEKPIRVLKLAGEFDAATLNKMRLAAYLYVSNSGSTSRAESCSFRFYKIASQWTESIITTLNGTELPNGYWYIEMDSSSLGVDLDGGSSIMMEVVMKRLGQTYRDRTYLNAVGIYGTAIRLRNEVEYLDITKADE